ncbi:Protein CBG26225 [Caenorhabditis briggsae]|uniref:Uncharacterized protein n=2 Tax=Caenorhabditis briggsae TaxID=6238 RepID=A0AAE9AEW3_CAEBR|nr:Protein CBG26225 [Caenorhabditis briggsae]ULT93180.1 hypothetical protein L3Y34_002985 [Caenorhabditis briggsae]CAR99860.1 Protein CBG26225 [Caenorhabditis briggsae]
MFWACEADGNTPVTLLELSKPLDLDPSDIPCLADKTFKLRGEEGYEMRETHAYGFDRQQMKHHRVVIEHFYTSGGVDRGFDNARWVFTEKYMVLNDLGGPLVYNSSGTAVVLGVKTNSPHDIHGDGVYFYNMAFIQDAVCEFSGICPPIIPPTTTTVPPPTPPPPTQNPNILESSTQPNASLSPRIPPNPNSNLTDYVETDFEEPNDFKVEVEYVNELDERELEVYFERDKFNASGGIEKDVNSFLIYMIFVIWRVFWN